VVELQVETLRGNAPLWWIDHTEPPGDDRSGEPGGSWERGDGSAQKLLAAFPPLAIPRLERILGGGLDFLPVHSLRHATALLQSNAASFSLIASGLHFDESRMFDLLRYARESFPQIPFVCCRVLETRVSRMFIEATALSATNLGALTYFDLPARAEAIGIEAAEQELRAVLLGAGRPGQ
jgi:hypothetical protein